MGGVAFLIGQLVDSVFNIIAAFIINSKKETGINTDNQIKKKFGIHTY